MRPRARRHPACYGGIMNREQKPEPSVEQQVAEMMRPKTEAEMAARRAEIAAAYKKADEVSRELRREARWRYLRSKEFRAEVWATFTFIGACWLGWFALTSREHRDFLIIYILIASGALSAVVRSISKQ